MARAIYKSELYLVDTLELFGVTLAQPVGYGHDKSREAEVESDSTLLRLGALVEGCR